MSRRWWQARPGLAGGIDNDGSRAAELLAAGFDSVEFGTAIAPTSAGQPGGVAALAARLSALPAQAAAIGIGIGAPAGCPPQALAEAWLAGLEQAWGAADYLSFNLSARHWRPLLCAEHRPQLLRAVGAVGAAAGGRRSAPGLTLKLPLAAADALTLAEAAAEAGFDAITAVLPDGPQRLARLRLLVAHLRGKAALLAVGGIRDGAGLRAVLAAGASGAQIHTAFAQSGAACLADFGFLAFSQ